MAHVESQLPSELVIKSVEEFTKFAETFKSGAIKSLLGAMMVVDIDLNGIENVLPIGLKEDGDCVAFNRAFIGNNRTISNATVENSEYAGLFCRLAFSAKVIDLRLGSTCKFEGRQAGAVAATADKVTLQNV